MASEQIQLRKRRCGPKVKTGCGTCKIRRVKCDESRPNCQRCSTTGRKCDGYGSVVTNLVQTSNKSSGLPLRINIHVPGNADERRGFEFFLHHTAAELSGYYHSSFWERLILAVSTQKPSLRHAVIGLGALHEEFSRSRSAPPSLAFDARGTLFALNQYTKAMGALRRSLSNGKEEPLTALLSCIMFVCFDSLRGWYESAMVHLESGLRIMDDMRKSSTDSQLVEEIIAPLLARLSIQSIIYTEAKSSHDRTVLARKMMAFLQKETAIPKIFESLEEARDLLNQTAFRMFYATDGSSPIASSSPDSNNQSKQISTQLLSWNIAFEAFMASMGKDFTTKEVQGAALLKIHHSTIKIMAGVHPEASDFGLYPDMVAPQHFHDFVTEFQIITNLARPLIAATEQDLRSGKPPLTFSSDLGLIGPLYYVCINCRIESIRQRAIELLLRCRRREGMWDSVVIAEMIQQFWDLESKHKEAQKIGVDVDDFGFLVPVSDTFNDQGSVHFKYFGRSKEIDIRFPSQCSPCTSITSTPSGD